jgi:type II secretion system protein H
MNLRANSEQTTAGMRTAPFNGRFARRSAAAFTLMEIMIVLVLISIMAAVIVPEMKGSFEDATLRSSAREIADVLTLAYSRSVSLNQPHRVQFDSQSSKYFLEQGTRGSDNEFVALKDVTGAEGKLSQRVTLELKKGSAAQADPERAPLENAFAEAPGGASLENAITFYPDGTADGCQIRLTDSSGFHLVLELNPVTSRVHFVDQKQP